MILILLPISLIGLIWAFWIGLYAPAILFLTLAVLPIANIIFFIPELINSYVFRQRFPGVQTFITSFFIILYISLFYAIALYFYSGVKLIPIMLLIMNYALSISNGIYQATKQIYGSYGTSLGVSLYGTFSHRASYLAGGLLVWFAPIITISGCIYAVL